MAGSVSSASASGSLAPDTSTRRSSSSGRSPGRSSRRLQPPLPGSTPPARAGRRPARRTDDLPLPDGPTMPRKPRADDAGDELGHEPLAAEEVVGIDRFEARETLERADPLSGHARRGDRARQNPGLLAYELEVDHLAGQLGLDLAQVAPARGGTRGDVDESPARLVDRDRERRPGELSAGRVALVRLLGQRPGYHAVERGRQLWPLLRLAPAIPPRGARTPLRGPSHAGMAPARGDTRRARSQASRRLRARRSPPPAICSGAT